MTDQETTTATTADTNAAATTAATTATAQTTQPAAGQQQTTTTQADPSIIGKGGTVDAGAQQTQQVAPADWPTDWRDKVAQQVKPGDAKFRERLDRFASPVEIGRSYFALEQKQSSGEVKSALPENATPEQLAAWRKDNGVPDTPEAYAIKTKRDEADLPIINEFLKAVHGKNWSNDRVNETLDAIDFVKAEQEKRLTDFDGNNFRAGEDALRAEWGNDYRRNVNAVNNLIATMPEQFQEQFLNGRLADGSKIRDNPQLIKWLGNLALELNPAATLVPGGVDGTKGVADRLTEIRKFRQENPDKYDNDKAMQAEELRLLDAQTKQRSRAA